MSSTTWKYGLGIGGVIALAMMVSYLLAGDPPDFDMMERVGWTSMILSSLAIFLGVRAAREENGGRIRFTEAFLKGLAIAAIAGGVVGLYSVIHIGVFDKEYNERYLEHQVTKMEASGMSQTDIEAELAETEELRAMLDNPLAQGFVMLVTVFLVGLLVALASGVILSNDKKGSSVGEPG